MVLVIEYLEFYLKGVDCKFYNVSIIYFSPSEYVLNIFKYRLYKLKVFILYVYVQFFSIYNYLEK